MAPEMAAKFDIDDRTGQIKVKTVLDFEAEVGDDNVDANDDRTFAVVVTATDPSLATKTAVTVSDCTVNGPERGAGVLVLTAKVTKWTVLVAIDRELRLSLSTTGCWRWYHGSRTPVAYVDAVDSRDRSGCG